MPADVQLDARGQEGERGREEDRGNETCVFSLMADFLASLSRLSGSLAGKRQPPCLIKMFLRTYRHCNNPYSDSLAGVWQAAHINKHICTCALTCGGTDTVAHHQPFVYFTSTQIHIYSSLHAFIHTPPHFHCIINRVYPCVLTLTVLCSSIASPCQT